MADGGSKKVLRCAVYTRKSTEEGLEQAFNSLHAQREACEAYILSQRHEGWLLVDTIYDDGGFTGGNLQRPALQQLLKEVKSGHVDTIVVYKVDRLTRSLADFAKIVEILDAAGASFVSVTQAFNTTTSMGRLTLNVLLSFAQFEREVTGERIRDKIAASKAKGMWMGGLPPLGYDADAGKLVVNDAEAGTVRLLFDLYLKLKSVDRLKLKAAQLGLASKVRQTTSGPRGGVSLSRGTLYHLLENPLYIGQIRHRGIQHPGQHHAIVDRKVYDKVQVLLARYKSLRRTGEKMADPSLLPRLLQDAAGGHFTPTHTLRRERRYRYYLSPPRADGSRFRLPAQALETAVLTTLVSHLEAPEKLLNLVRGVQVQSLTVANDRAQEWAAKLGAHQPSNLRTALGRLVTRVIYADEQLRIAVDLGHLLGEPAWQGSIHELAVPVKLRRRGMDLKLVVGADGNPISEPDGKLVELLAKGCAWFEELATGAADSMVSIAEREGLSAHHVTDLVNFAFLAPDLKAAILSGQQPAGLNSTRLKRSCPLALSWNDQRRIFLNTGLHEKMQISGR